MTADDLAGILPGSLEDDWADFDRSRRRLGRTDATRGVYRKSYERFWTWALDAGMTPDPATVTRSDINRWVDHLLEAPAVRNGRQLVTTDPATGEMVPRTLDPTTVRILWANLRPFFSWWAREMGTPSPFTGADPPKAPEKPVPVVELDAVRAVLRACSGTSFEDRRDQALIRLMYDVGARVGELDNMTVDSFDNRNDMVTLTGKTGSRTVPVSTSTGEALSRYVRVRRQHRSAGLPALWLGRRGRFGVSGIEQALASRCGQACVPRLHPHQLRHTWAHRMKTAGASEGDLMSLGGWSSTVMVQRYGRSAAAQRAAETARRIALGDEL